MTAVSLLALFILAPLVDSGPNGLDVERATVARVAARLPTARDYAGALTVREQSVRGRWFPLGDALAWPWLSGASGRAIRAAHVVALAAVAGVVALFVAEVSGLAGLGGLAGVIALSALQPRLGGDGVLGTSLEAPLATVLALLSATAALRTGRTAGLMTALAAVAAAATSIIGVAGVVAAAAVALTARRPRVAALLLLIAAAPVVASAVAGEPPQSLLRLATQPVRAVLAALTAPLPTSYRAAGLLVRDGTLFDGLDSRFWAFPAAGAMGWLLTLAAAGVAASAFVRPARAGITRSLAPLLAFGLVSWVAAALPDGGPAPGLRFGEGWSAAVLGATGVACCAAAAAALVLRRSDRRSRRVAAAATAVMIGAIVLGDVRTTRLVSDIDARKHRTRTLVEQAARRGFFDALPANARIAVDVPAAFFAGTDDGVGGPAAFLSALAGRPIEVAALPHNDRERANTPLYVLSSWKGRTHAVALWRWRGLRKPDPLADDVFRYRDYGDVLERRAALEATPVSDRGVEIATEQSGLRALIDHARRTCGPVALKDAFERQHARVTFGAGTFAPQPSEAYASVEGRVLAFGNTQLSDPRRMWRYAGASATLLVHTDGCSTGPYRFVVSVFAHRPTPFTLVAAGLRAYRGIASQRGTVVEVYLPSVERVAAVRIAAPEADRFPSGAWGPRYDRLRNDDARLLIVAPSATGLP